MVCMLGLTDQLVGITHECDYPAAIRQKPVVVRNALDLEKLSRAEIDTAVSARLQAGESLYRVDDFGAAQFLQIKDRKSTRLNSSHQIISYAVFCLKKKKKQMYVRER